MSFYRHFDPFLADINGDIETPQEVVAASPSPHLDLSEIDTVVVPAREEGFQKVFVGEKCWYAVRIHGTMRPQIKYIAAYRVAPISAITHIAPVRAIEPWKDTGKSVVYFSEPAKEISPIPLAKGGRVTPLQNLRYTSHQKLLSANSLEDIWGRADMAEIK